jgi:hypothetical protein
MNEDRWFEIQQELLLQMANTSLGRDLLCIPKDFPTIHKIAKNFIRNSRVNKDGSISHLTDFRVGAKWGNVIRYRWDDFMKAAYWFYANSWYSLNTHFPVIVSGSKRYTTSTFYPDPDAETTTCDGYAARVNVGGGNGQAWADLRGGAGTDTADSSTNTLLTKLIADTTENQWLQLYRGHTGFDTSSINTDVISSAVLSLQKSANDSQSGIGGSNNLVASSPASNTGLATSDYGNISGTTSWGAVNYADIAAAGSYTDMTLNATGLSNINKTGVTNIGHRQSNDMNNSAPSWSSLVVDEWYVEYAEAEATNEDPKLVVEHAAAPAGGGLVKLASNL